MDLRNKSGPRSKQSKSADQTAATYGRLTKAFFHLKTSLWRPDAHTSSRMSQAVCLGQLTDHGCTWHSEGSNKLVIKNEQDKTALIATREGLTGPHVTDACHPLGNPTKKTTTTTHCKACSAVARETIGQRIKFLHGLFGCPAPSTWTQAADKSFHDSVPHLKSSGIRKCLDPSTTASKGHMDQQCQNA